MMFPGLDRLQLTWRKPYAPILPWVAFVAGLCVLSYGIHALVLGAAEQEQVRLEADWIKARQQLSRHKEAKKAKGDLQRVWAVLPLFRDFAALALGVTEEAKRDQVTLPALSYAASGCVACHSVNGAEGIGPTWLGLFGRERPISGDGTVTADEAYIHESIKAPQAKIVAGFENQLMPDYGFNDDQIDDIVAYIKTLK